LIDAVVGGSIAKYSFPSRRCSRRLTNTRSELVLDDKYSKALQDVVAK
jgi:hypothetical protein